LTHSVHYDVQERLSPHKEFIFVMLNNSEWTYKKTLDIFMCSLIHDRQNATSSTNAVALCLYCNLKYPVVLSRTYSDESIFLQWQKYVRNL